MPYMGKREFLRTTKGEYANPEQAWKQIKEFRKAEKSGKGLFRAIRYLNETKPKFHKKRN
jgi:hypothetical protein